MTKFSHKNYDALEREDEDHPLRSEAAAALLQFNDTKIFTGNDSNHAAMEEESLTPSKQHVSPKNREMISGVIFEYSARISKNFKLEFAKVSLQITAVT